MVNKVINGETRIKGNKSRFLFRHVSVMSSASGQSG